MGGSPMPARSSDAPVSSAPGVADQLGHANSDVTAQHYLKWLA